jgi:hypothetical protein
MSPRIQGRSISRSIASPRSNIGAFSPRSLAGFVVLPLALTSWRSPGSEGRTARRPQVLTDQFEGWNSRTFLATARAPQAVRPPRCCDKRETRVGVPKLRLQCSSLMKRLRHDIANASDGHKLTLTRLLCMSASPPIADIVGRDRDVRFVPIADSRIAVIFCYSIVGSAAEHNGCGGLLRAFC